MNYRIDAMIAGAEKAGTTSLGHSLAAHPRILSHLGPASRSPGIEFDAFVSGACDDDDRFAREFRAAFPREPRPDDVILAKSVSIFHEPDPAHRLHAHNPECKLIISLRNPVDRAYSSYWYQRYRGAEPAETFEEALEHERQRAVQGVLEPDLAYLRKGRYIEHLQRLSELFGREQIEVVLISELRDRPREALNSVYAYLGLEAYSPEADALAPQNRARAPRWAFLSKFIYHESPVKTTVRHLVPTRPRRALLHWLREIGSVQRQKPPMDSKTRASLVEYFEPYNRRLERFLSRDLDQWNV